MSRMLRGGYCIELSLYIIRDAFNFGAKHKIKQHRVSLRRWRLSLISNFLVYWLGLFVVLYLLFFFLSCTSFVTYVISKKRYKNIGKKQRRKMLNHPSIEIELIIFLPVIYFLRFIPNTICNIFQVN